MDIKYKYEITSVDALARCMEVIYMAKGHPTMHISARVPFVGEELEDVIKAFAPLQLWRELSTEVNIPTVGYTGVFYASQAANSSDEVILPTTVIE